jgi:hypothetical protein
MEVNLLHGNGEPLRDLPCIRAQVVEAENLLRLLSHRHNLHVALGSVHFGYVVLQRLEKCVEHLKSGKKMPE